MPCLSEHILPCVGLGYAQPVVPMAPPLVSQLDDHGAGTVGVVGGPLSQLLEQNYAILNQFKQNMEVYNVDENTKLLVRFRDNILTVLNQMNAMQVNMPFLDSCALALFIMVNGVLWNIMWTWDAGCLKQQCTTHS